MENFDVTFSICMQQTFLHIPNLILKLYVLCLFIAVISLTTPNKLVPSLARAMKKDNEFGDI